MFMNIIMKDLECSYVDVAKRAPKFEHLVENMQKEEWSHTGELNQAGTVKRYLITVVILFG